MPSIFNERASGVNDEARAAQELKKSSEYLFNMAGSAGDLAKLLGNDVSLAKEFARTVGSVTTGFEEIAKYTETSGKELVENIKNRQKQLSIQEKMLELLEKTGKLSDDESYKVRQKISSLQQENNLYTERLRIAQNIAEEQKKLAESEERETKAREERLNAWKEIIKYNVESYNKNDSKLSKWAKGWKRQNEIDRQNVINIQQRIGADMAATGRTEMTSAEQAELDSAQAGADWSSFMSDWSGTWEGIVAGIASKMLSKLDSIEKSFFDKAESIFTEYKGSVNSRLIGIEKGFNDIEKLVSRNMVVYAGYARTEEILKNVNEAVKAGIAYNIEERAFLATVSDNIAQTFDAFDSNLLRVIRLQQSDSTAARMGLERDLTKLFNQYFSDSSYMSDMYDTVMSELIEATSTMTRNQSVEFEATAQKWLGALYSIGLSNSAVQSIASGINLLGSGNVEALAGNTQLQNLLAMSASRAGMDYGNLLISGFNGGSELNDLMYSMVDYLAEIADSTAENNVVRSAYGNVFNLTMSDWRAISNLGNSLSSIYSTNIDYGTALSSTRAGLSNINSIIGMPAVLNNLYENVMLNSALGVVKNPATYALYKSVNASEALTGGVQIPTISVFGNSIGLNTTLEALARTGIFGFSSAISSISQMFQFLNGISGTGLMGGDALSMWGGEDTITRGIGGNETLSVTSGETYSAQIGNASGEDAENSLISNATKDAKRQDKVKTGKNREEAEKTFDDLYYALFAPEAEAVLSTAGTSLTNINTEITTLNEDIRKAMHENAFNVNVRSFGGINMSSGIPVYFSGDNNASGVKQMDGFITKFISALGISTDQADLEAYTLQDLVNFFIDTVGAEEGTGLNVNLAGNEVSATSFLTGQSGFERY